MTTAYAKEVVHVDLGIIDLLNNTDNDPVVTTYQDKTGISNAGATSVYEHIDEDDRRDGELINMITIPLGLMVCASRIK